MSWRDGKQGMAPARLKMKTLNDNPYLTKPLAPPRPFPEPDRLHRLAPFPNLIDINLINPQKSEKNQSDPFFRNQSISRMPVAECGL